MLTIFLNEVLVRCSLHRHKYLDKVISLTASAEYVVHPPSMCSQRKKVLCLPSNSRLPRT